MADFDADWEIPGTPDPATPDPQPHQTQAQTAYQAPVQPAVTTVPGFAPPPTQQAVTTVPGFAPPPTQQTVTPAPGFAAPQAQAQQPYTQTVFVGYNINGPVYRNASGFVTRAPNADHTAEREANLMEIGKMINHFSPKGEIYKEYEKCRQDIDKFMKTSVAPFVWGILLILHGLISLFIGVTSKSKNNVMIYCSVAAGFIVLGVGFIALYFFKKKRHEKKVEALLEKYKDLSSQLRIVYNGYSSCVLPSEYTDPRLLYHFQSMIYHGKVFSIGAALNSLLAVPGVYQKVVNAKQQFETETAEMLNGTPAFFNAYRYFRLM